MATKTQTWIVGDGAARTCDVGNGSPTCYADAGEAAGYAAHSYGTDWIVVEAATEAEALAKGNAWDAIPRGMAGFEVEAFAALVRAEPESPRCPSCGLGARCACLLSEVEE